MKESFWDSRCLAKSFQFSSKLILILSLNDIYTLWGIIVFS